MVKLSLVLPPKPDDRWDLAKQMGVTDAVICFARSQRSSGFGGRTSESSTIPG